MEKENYKNLNEYDFKNEKGYYEPGTGTAAPGSGAGTAASNSGTSRATSRSVQEELVQRFVKMSIWEVQEEAAHMTDRQRAAFCVAVVASEADKSMALDKKVDHLEKICLLSPPDVTHSTIRMLVTVVLKLFPMEEDSNGPTLKQVGGTLGKTMQAARDDFNRATDELKAKKITMEDILQREKKADKEFVRCQGYAQSLLDLIQRSLDREDWRKGDTEKDRSLYKDAAELCKLYYELVLSQISDLREALQDALEKTEANIRILASQPKPEDPRLKELRDMNPSRVRDKMIHDSAYRSKAGELLRLARDKHAKDDVDMFEKLLFLGAEGKALDEALEKVKGPMRRRNPSGWLGGRIKSLQEQMNKAPTVSSGWGLLWGLVVIALFVGLAALLYLHPAVPPFIAGATEVVLAIGMIVCFLLGLAGGLIGGVLAALAWAFVTYLLNQLVPLETAMHIIVCILALVPSLFGLGWMMSSTPSARRKDQKDREKHIIGCHEEGKEVIEYINDLMACISPKASTENGQAAQGYYKAAAEAIRRMKPNT